MEKRIIAIGMLVIAALVLLITPVVKDSDKLASADASSYIEASQTTTVPDSSLDIPSNSSTSSSEPSTSSDTTTAVTTATDANSSSSDVTTKPTTITTKTTKTTTTTQGTKTPVKNGQYVSTHGQLSVKGADIVDKNGKKFQLIGMSTHGIAWFPSSVSKENFKVLRDDWGCNSIRLAMYVDEWNNNQCYLSNKTTNYNLVVKGIEAAIDLNMYVIVDWHVLNPGDPTKYTNEAKAFFTKIAQKYKDCPNIIYEVCNEPNGSVTWNGQIKSYCQTVISEIRKYDKDAIIVCGTGTWSQDIHDVVNNKINDKNVVYAFHFYADTHKDNFRTRVKDCYNNGLPILVSEFGTCDASGNSNFNANETKKWLNLLDSLNIGYFNWSLCNKAETASILVPNASLASMKSGTSQLTEGGKLIRSLYRKRTGLDK